MIEVSKVHPSKISRKLLDAGCSWQDCSWSLCNAVHALHSVFCLAGILSTRPFPISPWALCTQCLSSTRRQMLNIAMSLQLSVAPHQFPTQHDINRPTSHRLPKLQTLVPESRRKQLAAFAAHLSHAQWAHAAGRLRFFGAGLDSLATAKSTSCGSVKV